MRCPTSSSALKSHRQLSTAATRSGRFTRHRRRSHRFPIPPRPHFMNLPGDSCFTDCRSANSPVCGARHLRRRRCAFLFCRPRHTLMLCFFCPRQRRATRPRPHISVIMTSAIFYHAEPSLSTKSLSPLCQLHGKIVSYPWVFVHLFLT